MLNAFLAQFPRVCFKAIFFSNSLAHLIWLHKILYINYCKLCQISRFDREVTRWKGKSSREHPVRSPASAHPQTWKSTNALNLNILKLVRCCPHDNQGLSDPIWPGFFLKLFAADAGRQQVLVPLTALALPTLCWWHAVTVAGLL